MIPSIFFGDGVSAGANKYNDAIDIPTYPYASDNFSSGIYSLSIA